MSNLKVISWFCFVREQQNVGKVKSYRSGIDKKKYFFTVCQRRLNTIYIISRHRLSFHPVKQRFKFEICANQFLAHYICIKMNCRLLLCNCFPVCCRTEFSCVYLCALMCKEISPRYILNHLP